MEFTDFLPACQQAWIDSLTGTKALDRIEKCVGGEFFARAGLVTLDRGQMVLRKISDVLSCRNDSGSILRFDQTGQAFHMGQIGCRLRGRDRSEFRL